MMDQSSHRLRSLALKMLATSLLALALCTGLSVYASTAHALAQAPLSVTITSPVNGAVIGTRIPTTVSASVVTSTTNTMITVNFYSSLNGGTATLIGTATSAPYSISWTPLSPGDAVLTARASDNLGDVAVSNPVSIIIAVTDPLPPPAISITSPANGTTFTAPANILITAALTRPSNPISEVDFYSGSTLLGKSTTAPYSFDWINVPVGFYSLTATAIDDFGLKGTSAPVTVTVASANPYCQVTYTVTNQWQGGFTANVAITNLSSTTINGWTLAFTFLGDQKITSMWGATYVQVDEQVTATNVSWDASIPPGGTVSPGFNGVWNLNNTSPNAFTLNGQLCS